MVTGIAILLAGFIQVNTISTYHWHTVVYLAWMSSNVHLITLAVLRGHMQTSPIVRAIRVIGMTILFILLFAALLPTMSYDYQYSLGTDRCEYRNDPNSFQSVAELWTSKHLSDNNSLQILSILLLAFSYIWKPGTLFKRSSHFAKTWLQQKPSMLLSRAIRRLRNYRQALRHKSPLLHSLTFWPYAQLIGLHATITAFYDLLASFVASIWILSIVLGWGTLNLLKAYIDYGQDEREWTFGQIVPVLMLILPVMAMSQEFFGP